MSERIDKKGLKEAIGSFLEACEDMKTALNKMEEITQDPYDEWLQYCPTKEGWDKVESGRYTAAGHLEIVILGLNEILGGFPE